MLSLMEEVRTVVADQCWISARNIENDDTFGYLGLDWRDRSAISSQLLKRFGVLVPCAAPFWRDKTVEHLTTYVEERTPRRPAA